MTRRLVRSPPAPKIVMVAGGAWRPEAVLAAVAEAAGAIVSASLIALPCDTIVRPIGRDRHECSRGYDTETNLALMSSNVPRSTPTAVLYRVAGQCRLQAGQRP